jgi:Flp pilus assembly pilin Flp
MGWYAWLKRIWTNEDGQDLAEYALLFVLIVIVVIIAVTALGTQMSTVWSTVTAALSS